MKILVVEDDANKCSSILDTIDLFCPGAEVVIAPTAAEFNTIAPSLNDFNIAFLDHDLGDGDASEVMKLHESVFNALLKPLFVLTSGNPPRMRWMMEFLDDHSCNFKTTGLLGSSTLVEILNNYCPGPPAPSAPPSVAGAQDLEK